MTDWRTFRLDEVADSCLGKMLDREKNRGEYRPYLANINVRWGAFDLANLSQMRFEDTEDERYGLEFGDVVVCEVGEPGRCAIWRNQTSQMKFQKALHRLRPKTGFSNEFLFYRMLLAGQTGELEKHFNGSTIKHLTGTSLKRVEFSYPPLATQQRIAAVLSALDAKIELNQQLKAELEGMAKLLYDYWFVQYDFPLSAAQAAALGKPHLTGKPYRSSGGPMVYNEQLKRKIPEGWGEAPLGRVVSKIIDHRGKTPTKLGGEWSENPDDIIALSAKHVKNGTLVDLQRANRVSPALYEKWMPEKLADGDVLMTSEAPAGEFYFIHGDSSYCLSQRLFALRANTDVVLPSYFYNEISRGHSYSEIMGSLSGSTVFGIRQDVLRNILVMTPDTEIQKQFNSIYLPWIAQIRNLEQQNQELATLRDWLLPVLMNGQIRVTG